MNKLQWLSFMLQKKLLGRSDVFVNGRLYMRRWLFGPAWGPGLRIHNIVKSDAGFELHDHPFDFVSLIVKGGYKEITGEFAMADKPVAGRRKAKYYGPLSILFRKAEDLHRIMLLPTVVTIDGKQRLQEQPAWTVVLRGPIRREWGFMTAAGWLHWKEYVAAKHAQQGNTVGGFAAKSST